MREPLLLDTHIWVWGMLGLPELTEDNRRLVLSSQPLLSSMSIYEAGYKIARGRWLGVPPDLWPDILAALPASGITEIVPDAEVFRRAATLDWAHGDPGDRVLVTEAQRRGIPILTRDRALHAYDRVETIWL